MQRQQCYAIALACCRVADRFDHDFSLPQMLQCQYRQPHVGMTLLYHGPDAQELCMQLLRRLQQTGIWAWLPSS